VQGTPTIFIDGQRYNGAITVAALKPILDAEMKLKGAIARVR
jgi:protein-disulfide isomerase